MAGPALPWHAIYCNVATWTVKYWRGLWGSRGSRDSSDSKGSKDSKGSNDGERRLQCRERLETKSGLLAGTTHGTTVDRRLQRQCITLYEIGVFIVA